MRALPSMREFYQWEENRKAQAKIRIIGGEHRGAPHRSAEPRRPAPHARPRARDAVQLAGTDARGTKLPGSLRRQRRARLRGRLARRGTRRHGGDRPRRVRCTPEDARAHACPPGRHRSRAMRSTTCAKSAERFDVVFLDPPFRQNALPSGCSSACPVGSRPAHASMSRRPGRSKPAEPWRELKRARAGQVSYQLLEMKVR